MKDNIVELLSPAGDMEKLNAALNFGADAVYLAGKEFGMRCSTSNFDIDELKKAIEITHKKNKKVYLTCNTLPRNDEIDRIPEFLSTAQDLGVDAFIIADMGILGLAKKFAPKTAVHISTQFGITNYMSARELHSMGAQRIVLSRELSLEEISTIRAKTDKSLELEAFVHGAMCVSFSGRCLISNFLTGRDANRGNCAQACRWKYYLTEEKRKGEYFPITETDKGTYFFNSKDLCMIEYIPQLLEAGITSLKIEGRAKSSYYVAVVTNAYKHALKLFYKDPCNYKLENWIKEEVYKISHREYSTGFYFGNSPGQVYDSGGYVREYEVVAVCEGSEKGFIRVSQRNRFFKGDKLEILEPEGEPFEITVEKILDENGNEMQCAPHPTQKLLIPLNKAVKPGAFLRAPLRKETKN